MNSHGKNVKTSAPHKYGEDSCIFHPDVVTAKTISRLSKGVARLTANDNDVPSPKSVDVISPNEEIVPYFWTKNSAHNLFTGDLRNDSSSSFGLYTQRSSVARLKLSLPTLNTGSKRSFSYVLGSACSLNGNSCTNTLLAPRNTSFRSRFPYSSCCDAISSGSSMLSVTPPRSEPTASSSPILTSSPDESRVFSCLHSMRRKHWRKRRKDWWHRKRESHSAGGTDYRWNSSHNLTPLLCERSDGRSSTHRIFRRCDIFDVEEDSSEEGPLKKARVTKNIFENIQRRRCRCNGLLRRAASLSPRRSYPRSSLMQHENMVIDSKRNRKPTKFRKSLLTTRTIGKHFSKYNDNLNENRSSKSRPCQHLKDHSDNGEEGDDECSDETPGA